MQTRPSVLQLMNDLAMRCRFQHVGMAIPHALVQPYDVVQVGDWKAARKTVMSQDTESFLTETMNELYNEIDDSMVRLGIPPKQWVRAFNRWIAQTRTSIQKLATDLCTASCLPASMRAQCVIPVDWIIGEACIIKQYEEHIQENLLYLRLAEILAAGHFVCGWHGRYPIGQLVVF